MAIPQVGYSVDTFRGPPAEHKDPEEYVTKQSLERQLAERICDWYDRWIFEQDTTPDPELLAKKLRGWARELGY